MTSRDVPYALLFLLFTSCSLARCQDFVRTTYCWNQEFRLDCHWNSVLAIHEAYFTNDEVLVNQSSCSSARDGRPKCTEDIRSVVNKRCSGMPHCNFDLTLDFPDRECRCSGIIVLLYSCVPAGKLSYPNTHQSPAQSQGLPNKGPSAPGVGFANINVCWCMSIQAGKLSYSNTHQSPAQSQRLPNKGPSAPGVGFDNINVLVYVEPKIEKTCNIKITGNSGYISSPGYPRFYPKVSNCTWTLDSSRGQEMKLTILDLNMRRGVHTRGKVFCPDSLTILEDGHKVKYSCGEADDKTRIPILTKGGEVQIAFRSNEFLPARGFLLYYKFNGCKALAAPKAGYLVYSNNRSALYMCCKGHVFNDSLSNSLFLQCVDGTFWNGTVTPCLTIDEALRARRNSSDDVDELFSVEKADVVEVYLNKHKYIEEILIPVASVVGLVFGNLAIILGIQRYRKKRKTNTSHHNGRVVTKRNSSTTTNTEVPQTLHVPVTVPIDSTIPHAAPLPTLHQAPVVRQAPRVLMTDL